MQPCELTRRQWLSHLAFGAGAMVLSDYLCATNRPQIGDPAWGTVSEDPRLLLSNISFKSGTDNVPAILAYPRVGRHHRPVLVIHASWLVEPYVGETVAMLAKAGFVGLAVDLFHFFPKVSSWEEARKVQGPKTAKLLEEEFREPRMIRNLQSGIDYLRAQPFTAAGAVGVIGFCGGGWNALLFGAQSNDVGAVVAFYAPVGSSDIQHRAPIDVASYLRAPVQYHGVRNDPDAPSADVDRLQGILAAQGTPFERYTYDAKHGFFAYDRDGVFDRAAARLSWERTVAFLHHHLGRPAPLHRLAPAPSMDSSGKASSSGDHLLFHNH